MKQYKITSQDLVPKDTTDDCVLAPDDPVHELIATSMLGGLGAREALAKYNADTLAKRIKEVSENNQSNLITFRGRKK